MRRKRGNLFQAGRPAGKKGGRADQLCEGQGLPLRQQDPDLRPAPGVHPVRLRPERETVHDNTAKGIIAIGNCAIGVVAIGIVGVGLFTFGVLAMGMLSLGIVAGGLAAFGVAALGYLALGVSAVGVYAGGVAAIAAKIAVAVSSVAPTAVGEFASGSHVLLWGDGLTAPEVQTFLLEHHPDLWRPLLRLLTEIGAHIK